MGTQAQMQFETAADAPQEIRWKSPTRILFRFGCLYFTLYVLTTQVFNGLFPIPIPDFEVPDLSATPPVRQAVFWLAQHVFQVPQSKIVYQGSGSG
ncbi:MAG TPA: hypothetical protein VKE70_03565, partial [Candidatus Solibacter sp.]|nr:hypothetical protein [Candidatus Solibacter sp.]